MNPPGGIYTTGTVVMVTATPNSGYAFSHWSGSLGGSVNPATVTMNGDKNVTANYVVSFGEPVPWVVDFNGLGTGVTSQGWPTSWTATRGGTFRASGDRLEINSSGGEGVFRTGVIDITGCAVNLSLSVRGAGGLDSSDYVRLYIKTNAGPETLVRQVIGAQPAATWTRNGITGTNLQVVLRTSVTAADEFYYFDNLVITNAAPVSLDVSIPQAGGAIQIQWAGGGTLQTATDMSGPWSDLLGAASPCLIPATNSAQFFRVNKPDGLRPSGANMKSK